MKNDAVDNVKGVEKTFGGYFGPKSPSKVGFVALLIMYLATAVLINWATHTGGVIMVFGGAVPIPSLAGIFSSLGNFCLIFLTVFYRKPGFIVSIAILLVQLPPFLWNMFSSQNFSNIPGLFMSLFTIVVLVLLYLNISRNEKYQERLRKQAITDRLTGLPNRFGSTEVTEQLVERGEKFTVVSIDLNNFKGINDTMGHSVGDQVLIEIASRLERAARSGKTQTVDFVAHQGGDEFAIIIQKYKSAEAVAETIEYYKSVLEEKVTIDDCDYVVTGSYGYAEFPTDADNGDTLFTYADAAMYEAKRGSNDGRVCRFSPEILDAEQTLEMERKIRAAIDDNTLYFLLQPQFDISHNLRGFEALARMKDADGNVVSPAEFIPVAEKVGLVDKIDANVFRDSAKFLGDLIERTGTTITLSVNVSVRHLMKNDFVDEVKNILKESGVPASQIEIEITESIMIDSAEKALQCINEIKGMGVKVAIDDFGTGYSSLSYLNTFPADLLKVDKSFIDKMNTNTSSMQYVAAIISIGHIMNFSVISEGVEEVEQLDTLRSIGCDYVQGFIWGRPMPPEDAEALVVEAMQA